MGFALAFDTYEFVQTLKQAGMPEQQAEAISTAVRKSQANLEVATKQDLLDVNRNLSQETADFKNEFQQEMARLRSEFQQEMARLRSEFQQEMARLRSEFQQDVAELHHKIERLGLQMIIRVGAMVATATSIIVAAIKWL
jgi:cell division septum initiation protein DivIVA